MTIINLKDAYFTLPITPKARKYVFPDNRNYIRFAGFFCLSPAPRIFTKTMRPPMTILRQMRHELAYYAAKIE